MTRGPARRQEQPLQTRGRLERWELAPKDVQIKQRLGQGDGGVIHLAKWRGLMCVAKMLHQVWERRLLWGGGV